MKIVLLWGGEELKFDGGDKNLVGVILVGRNEQFLAGGGGLSPISPSTKNPANYFIFFKKINFSEKTSYKWLMNKPDALIYTFCKHLSFISCCVFPVSILNVAYKKACKIAEPKQYEFINTKIFGAHFKIYFSLISC